MSHLTPDQEARGAELFAAGATERDVAEALACSASTAHRLRERLQGASVAPSATEVTAEAAEVPPGEAAARVLELTGLAETAAVAHAETAGTVATFAGRAEAARAGAAALEQERAEILLAGGDAAGLRARMANARDDLDDCELAEQLARERLQAIEAHQAGIAVQLAAAEREAALEAAWQEAQALAARLASATPDDPRALHKVLSDPKRGPAWLDLAAALIAAEQRAGRDAVTLTGAGLSGYLDVKTGQPQEAVNHAWALIPGPQPQPERPRTADEIQAERMRDGLALAPRQTSGPPMLYDPPGMGGARPPQHLINYLHSR